MNLEAVISSISGKYVCLATLYYTSASFKGRSGPDRRVFFFAKITRY